MEIQRTRVSIKRVHPNPLFQEWLKELYEESVQKRSKLEPMLKVANESLTKYPLPLQSGAECAILQGFKKPLCDFIELRLIVHRQNLNLQLNNDLACQVADNSPIVENPITHGSISNNSNISENVTSTVKLVKSRDCVALSTNPCSDYIETATTSNSVVNTIQCIEPSGSGPEKLTTRNYDFQRNLLVTNNHYKPLPESGTYALLKTLFEYAEKNPEKPHLNKKELVDNAQKYCDQPFISGIWQEMSGLMSRGYVLSKKCKKTVYYYLTHDGLAFSRKMLNATEAPINITDTQDTVQNSSNHNKNSKQVSDLLSDLVKLPANSFDVILLIDKKETTSVTKWNTVLEKSFQKFPNFKYEYRDLKVGDFTWIARHKVNEDQELVLPYIIERKRMDDFASSIKDGRFHEQKFRLEKCGLNTVIYLVEKYDKNKYIGLPLQTLKQALVNTRVQDKFKIHVTGSFADSFNFLTIMTQHLDMLYKGKNLQGGDCKSDGDDLMTFKFFNSASSKTKALSVNETFIKMLLQLKGLSVEKALAISNKYKTPKNLIEAYKNCEDRDRHGLLANLKFCESNRRVGNNISTIIHYLFAASNVSASKTP